MRALSIAATSFTSLLAVAAPVITPVFAQTGPNSASAAGTVTATQMTETVAFTNGTTSLNGVIENVTSPGRHAAVLILPGSGANAADAAHRIAKAFAAKGIVALTYDSPTTNAADAIAATNVLRTRGDVLGDKIGIVGIGDAAAVATAVAKSQDLNYAVAIGPTADPSECNKLSHKALVIHGTDDAFSESAEKMKNSIEKKHHNITFWLAPNEDIASLGAANSSLLDRITTWTNERNS